MFLKEENQLHLFIEFDETSCKKNTGETTAYNACEVSYNFDTINFEKKAFIPKKEP